MIESVLQAGLAFNAEFPVRTRVPRAGRVLEENPIERAQYVSAQNFASLLEGSTFMHTLEKVEGDQLGYVFLSGLGWPTKLGWLLQCADVPYLSGFGILYPGGGALALLALCAI
jgi:hypothetical protein